MSLVYSDFLRSLIHILEAKKMHFPRFIYCIMIFVMYSQFAGYVFCTYESKPLNDPKIVFYAHWNEFSTGTFLLFVASDDNMTLMFFWFFQSMLYCYFIYIIILTLLDHYQPKLKAKYQSFFDVLNTFYQFFFSSFLWVFYVPFTEINSGIIVCGNNSFLKQYRTGNCNKPFYFYLLGGLGLVLTFTTGCVLCYFYVNYQFLEKNYLKRRFQPNQIIQLLCRTMLIFLYYLDISNIIIVKHIVSHILGLTSCYDFLKYLPFRDQFICTFYGCATVIYEYSMILFSFWELTPFLEEFNIFFSWIMGSSFIIVFVILYVRYYYFQAILLLPGSINNSNSYCLDILLEEIMQLTMQSESDESSKLQIQGLMQRMEQKLPNNVNFFQKKHYLKQILSKNQQIDTVKIVKIIKELFCIFLKDPQVSGMKSIYEYISLKYCSFLGSYLDNPIKAYYELKNLLSMNNQPGLSSAHRYQPSIIFLIISQVITTNIQDLLIETFKIKYDMEINLNDCEKSETSELVWKTLPISVEYKLNFVSKMSNLVKCKLKFWENLCMGYSQMDDFLKESLNLMKKIENFTSEFNSSLNETNLPGLKNNVVYLKLMALYNLMILNDNIKAKVFEDKVKEIKKNDTGLKEGLVNSFSILSGNSIVIQISLLKDKGTIVNRKTHQMANFFGYQLQNFQSIISINSLMPEILAKNHSLFLNKFIKNGPSMNYVNGITAFGLMNQGFIFSLKLNLNLNFVSHDDFVVSGVLTKSAESTFTFIFNEIGDILGVSDSLAKEIPKGLSRKEVLKIYDCYKIFWLMPELLEKLPSLETMRRLVEKKEYFSELISNGRVSVYFPKELDPLFDFIAKYKIKHEILFKSLKSYDNLLQKEIKIIMKKFCYFGNTKCFLNKNLARFSLRNELYFTSNKKYVSYFILTIHELYKTENLHDLDYLSYSIEKTNTTQTSQYTCLTIKSDNQIVAAQEIQIPEESSNKKDIKSSKENLKMENLPKENTSPILNLTLPEKLDTNQNNKYTPPGENKTAPPQIDPPDKKMIIIEEEEKSLKKEEMISDEGKNKDTDDEERRDDKDVRESSVRSTSSSIFTNKGLAFISEFIKHGKIMVLLKKIFIILGFQILVFFLIDIIYIILIKSKFDDYNSNLSESANPSHLLNFYCKTLISASSYQIVSNGLISENELEDSKDSLENLIETSYLSWQSFFSDESQSLLGKSIYQDPLLIKFIDNDNILYNATNEKSMAFVTFSEETQSLIYSLLQDNSDELSYFQMRVNFIAFVQEILKISDFLMNQLQNGKDSFISFYIYLTIIGICSAFFLQILSFPLYRKYYKYLEKVLVLVTKLQEKECDNELYKLKHFVHYLDSNEESYMILGISKLEGERKLLRALEKKSARPEENSDFNKRAKSAKKSNYLTSRINNHQINMHSFKVVFFLSLLLVTGYYGGAFLFLIQINNYLNYVNNIMEFTNTMYLSSNTINLSRRFLVSWEYVSDKTYLDTDDISGLKQLFSNSMQSLQLTLDQRIEIANGQVPDNYLEGISLVLNNDSCNYAINVKDCEMLDLDNFKYGLREYILYFLNKVDLTKDQVLNPENLTLDQVKVLIKPEATLLLAITNYRIMEETMNILEEQSIDATKQLLNALYNNLFMLFVVGGILCSCVWGVLALRRIKIMWNEINLSKKLLIMIPINKLNEESTLHLMRNLENI